MKRFVKNDAGFVCTHCKKAVSPLGYTSRNHCPYCLWSLHVDINPGDRENTCRGAMEPISALPDAKKDFILIHRCTVCGAIKRNKIAEDDDRMQVIRLTAGK